jgi:drug/metabolite transporter (DMT)-like permease
MIGAVTRRHLALLALGVVAVSFSAVFVRLADAPALAVAFYRCLFACVVLVPIALVRHREVLRDLPRDRRWLLLASGVALAAHFATWISSLSFTSVAAAAVLVQTMPIWVALLGPLVGERTPRAAWLGIGVALVGTVVIGSGGLDGGGSRPILGDVLATLGAIFAAVYVLLGRRVRRTLPVVPYSAVVYAVAAIGLGVAMAASGTPFTGFSTQTWLLFAAITAGPQFLGHTLFNYLLGHVRASVVSVALLGEPVGATVLAMIFLDEVPTALTMVGAAIILVGVFLAIRAEAAEGREIVAAPLE